jgi:hypothetical protein
MNEVIASTVCIAVASGAPVAADLTSLNLRDDFIGRSTTTSTIVGDLAWTLAVVGAGAISLVNGSWPHIGIGQLTSGATASGSITLNLLGSLRPFSAVINNPNWQVAFHFKLAQTTGSRLYLGFYDAAGTLPFLPTNSLWLRFDSPGKGDVNFQYVTRKASVEVAVDSGIAPDTNWHTFRMSSVVANSIQCQIDNNPSTTLTAGDLPTASMTAQMSMGNGIAGAVTCQIDAFGFYAYGLPRVI